jgi:hypothetical protein
VKEDEMGKACSAYGREAEFLHGFGGKIKRKKTTNKT